MEELIRQIRYIVNVGGEECLGLGSDFDGIEEAPEMENAGGMEKLAEAMEKAGISHRLTEKNFLEKCGQVFAGEPLKIRRDMKSRELTYSGVKFTDT